MSIIGSMDFLEDSFIEGAARAFWVLSYADYIEQMKQEGYDIDPDDWPAPGAGEDWMDVSPDTPEEAVEFAQEFVDDLKQANKKTITEIVKMASKADKHDVNPEEFGRLIAMDALGTGVSWFDSHKQFPIEIPHVMVDIHQFVDIEDE